MKKVFLSCLAILMFLIPFSPVTSAASGDRLIYDTMYNVAGGGLVSNNNRFSFQFDNWGDAQIWDVKTRTMIWNSKTKDTRIHKLQINYFSGKLVISDPQNTPYWTSDNLAWAKAWYGADNVPANFRGNVLIMQTDGNLVLYNNENPALGWYPVWASNTGGH
ncbi:hypothetical protein P5G61_16665 [Paenibacillus sp. F6_3S_P_1C]|uniref:Bulb-type lectin domain-containing protein n=1 Tax=Paenibacillus vandeheii TaxID=3035917 RepID=A0ABT8JCQ0_9BACL|nr:hypothetical protein [Paenibacillus vandeheii]MDN4602873.1 hypothetical protein [Paenibacillus vandeheii]